MRPEDVGLVEVNVEDYDHDLANVWQRRLSETTDYTNIPWGTKQRNSIPLNRKTLNFHVTPCLGTTTASNAHSLLLSTKNTKETNSQQSNNNTEKFKSIELRKKHRLGGVSNPKIVNRTIEYEFS